MRLSLWVKKMKDNFILKKDFEERLNDDMKERFKVFSEDLRIEFEKKYEKVKNEIEFMGEENGIFELNEVNFDLEVDKKVEVFPEDLQTEDKMNLRS